MSFPEQTESVQEPAENRLGVVENARVAESPTRGATRTESEGTVRPLRATTRDDTDATWRSTRKADMVCSVILEGGSERTRTGPSADVR